MNEWIIAVSWADKLSECANTRYIQFVCLPDWGYWHDDVTNKIALNAIVKHFNYQVKNCSFQKRNSSFTEPKQ